ncbi:MAG: hypothetical protein ACR65R_01920 [Methylomicrobium sp.]
MKSLPILWMIVASFTSHAVWAYGSSSSSKACEKPGFSQFSPPDKADVSPNAGFSFIASPNTKPETIKVAVKNSPVSVAVKPVAQGFQVSGTLPAALLGTFARISINAEGANQCKGNGGWLVNIGK